MNKHDPSLSDTYRVSLEDAHYKVYAKAIYYPDFVRIYIPNKPFEKIYPGLEINRKTSPSNQSTQGQYEDDLARSIRRTRKTVKDYVLCNEFELFATFTFKSDRQDIDKCRKKMANWFKNQQKIYGKFQYLVVPEFHKDNKSLHFHALISGYRGKLKQAVNPKTSKILAGIYVFPGYRSGYTTVKIIDKNKDSRTKISLYIQKYITKNMPLFSNKKRYWSSKNLLLPITEENPEGWYKYTQWDDHFMNDYGTFLDFYYDKHPFAEIFRKANK